MKSYVSKALLFGLLFWAGCAPAIDSPKAYNNDTIKFSYPGNWDVIDSGSTIVVQEKVFFGMFDGTTSIRLSIDDVVSRPPKFEHNREVVTKTKNETVKGQLSFDWVKGLFQTSYFIEKGDHSVRILVDGVNESLEASEPGIRQVLESLELL